MMIYLVLGHWNLKMATDINLIIALWLQGHCRIQMSRYLMVYMTFKVTGILQVNGHMTEWILQAKKVGIIGTGSSAVQAIPVIAKQAKHLTVFQRTANYSIPANQRELSDIEITEVKANYNQIRESARLDKAGISRRNASDQSIFDVDKEERELEFQKRWDIGGTPFTGAYKDINETDEANKYAADFVKNKIREIVKDPNVANLLCPTNTIGCKRLCADTGYFETYNRDNVQLVDINNTPIEQLIGNGLKTTEKEYDFDIIIFAIGFDAMTGALKSMNIVGKNNIALNDKWSSGPKTYLGLTISGFPNLFTITGPGSPSVLSNMMTAIEQHVEWISDCIQFMGNTGKKEIEATLLSEDEWVDHVESIASGTLRYGCNSWYVGANVPGKKRIFMPYAGGIPLYNDKCAEVASNDYKGFTLV
jgi:cation diffusion facilitator CzcD-associated flavoprotein CzcO